MLLAASSEAREADQVLLPPADDQTSTWQPLRDTPACLHMHHMVGTPKMDTHTYMVDTYSGHTQGGHTECTLKHKPCTHFPRPRPTVTLRPMKELLVQLKRSGGSQPFSPLQCRMAFPGAEDEYVFTTRTQLLILLGVQPAHV